MKLFSLTCESKEKERKRPVNRGNMVQDRVLSGVFNRHLKEEFTMTQNKLSIFPAHTISLQLISLEIERNDFRQLKPSRIGNWLHKSSVFEICQSFCKVRNFIFTKTKLCLLF